MVSLGHRFADGITSNGNGDVFFSGSENSTIHKIDSDNKTTLFAKGTGKACGLTFGHDGKLYACAALKQEVVACAADDSDDVKVITVASGVYGGNLCIRADGTIYAASARKDVLIRISPDSKSSEMLDFVSDGQGIVFSPYQAQIYVSSSYGRMATAVQVQQNDDLINRQPFYWLHFPDRTDKPMLGRITVDNRRMAVRQQQIGYSGLRSSGTSQLHHSCACGS